MELSTIFSTSNFIIYARPTSSLGDKNENFVFFVVFLLLEDVVEILRTGTEWRKKKKWNFGGVFLAIFFFYWKVAL